jgi:hypothetical protein
MAYTVQEVCESAFAEIGMAAYVFDLSPDMLTSAANRLVAMLGEWNAKGIRLGAPLASSPGSIDLDESSNVPTGAIETVITNLAIRLAPSYGKTVSPDTKVTAKRGYDTLMAQAARAEPMQLPGDMPAGAGNKPWRWYYGPFILPPADPILGGPDGPIDFQ